MIVFLSNFCCFFWARNLWGGNVFLLGASFQCLEVDSCMGEVD